jgi:hypothetical protein
VNEVYITSIKQISAQQPLTDEWFKTPMQYSENYVRSIDPDFKQYFASNTARRLGKILKRALVVSQKVFEESGVAKPDAIITGTGLGCIENTELFLNKLVREGEELLNPTQFMQSTHNTISSLVALEAKCHNYNTTYVHKGVSFECALQDAFLHMQCRDGAPISTAIVGAYDEMLPVYFFRLKKAGYLGRKNQVFAGETAVAMMLSNRFVNNVLCKIENVEKFYGNDLGKFSIFNTQCPIDAVMVGTNGVAENDNIYFENCKKLFPNIPLLQYKHIFGESYTAPAFGVYAAALCLKNGEIPEHLFFDTNHKIQDIRKNHRILCYNQFEGKNHTFVILSK